MGLPRTVRKRTRDAFDGLYKQDETHLWYDNEWRDKIRCFYLAAHAGTPAPTDKTVKKFVRGFVQWVRSEIYKRKYV